MANVGTGGSRRHPRLLGFSHFLDTGAMDRSHAVAIKRAERICEQTDDERSLRISLLGEIRRVVPFDAYSWLLTDPETEVGCSPLADVPCLPELPRLIRLKYLTEVNRWTQLDGPVALLSTATGGQLDRSLVWRALLRSYEVTDIASLVFRDRFGCWAFLELWRVGRGTVFHESEAAFLAAATPSITAALRRAIASTFHGGVQSQPTPGPVVLMLSPELAVKAQTPETENYLRLLVPPEGDRPPVPSAAYNVGAQLCAIEAGVDHHPATARVHFSDGIWLTLRAARISDGSARDVPADVAVTIERSSPGERLGVFALASGLTQRESDVLRQLATGADTRELAKRMFVSEHTVQDHLKSIFDKTNTRSRNRLLAIATGTEAPKAGQLKL